MSQPGYPGDVTFRLPKPGPALKLVLGLVIAFAILGAALGAPVYKWLAFVPGDFTSALRDYHVPHVWAFVTAGLVTAPDIVQVVFVLLGLYFLTPELERRWGGARLLRFLAIAVVFGNLFVLAGSMLPFGPPSFHPPVAMGPLAAIAAITMAWAKENWEAKARFMMVLPLSGKAMFYLTIGIAAVTAAFGTSLSEGALAPLGGCLAAALFSGTPSPARTAWLKLRLGSLRRQGGGGGITVSELLGDAPPRSRPSAIRGSAKKAGPALRIVQGGLENELKNRKVPKDKRYLN